MALVLLDDRPLGALGTNDGRADAAKVLCEAAQSVRAPACVAVYGPWGSGKTSMLGALRGLWDRDGLGPVVWFDPWVYERRTDVLTALLVEVGRALRRSDESRWGRVKGLLAGALKVTVELGVRATSAALFGGMVPELAKLDGLKDISVKDLGDLFERAERWTDGVQQVGRLFRMILKECVPRGRLLVLLDDLDRCQPEHALDLIEGVKLLLCGAWEDGAENAGAEAVFVFALDRHVVGEAIRQRYPRSSLYTGESYLEKIFDLSVEVPGLPSFDASRAVTAWLGALGNKAEMEATLGDLGVVVGVLIREPFNNPRVAKRTINRLSLLVRARPGIVARMGASHPPSPGEQRSAEVLSRLVGWVALVERYRSFRLFVRSASRGDLTSLMVAVTNCLEQAPSGGAELSREAAALLATPGLALALRDRLSLRADDLEGAPGEGRAAGTAMPLALEDPRWRNPPLLLIDDLLREVGL